MSSSDSLNEYYQAILDPICSKQDIKRVVIYLGRKDTDVRDILDYCPHWSIVGIFGGDYGSDTPESNAEIQKMLEFCQKGEADLILCNSLSHVSRNIESAVEIINRFHCLQPSVGFYLVKDNLYSKDYDMSSYGTFLAKIISETEHKYRSQAAKCGWITRKRKLERDSFALNTQ